MLFGTRGVGTAGLMQAVAGCALVEVGAAPTETRSLLYVVLLQDLFSGAAS